MKCQSCGDPATVHFHEHRERQEAGSSISARLARRSRKLIKNQELNLSLILQTVLGQQVGQTDRRALSIDLPHLRHKVHGVQGGGTTRLPAGLQSLPVGPRTAPGTDSPLAPACSARCRPNASADAERQRQLIDLRVRLTRAVDEEKYEEAAKLRDRIRELTQAGPTDE